jgi:hypothetical protein
MPLNTDKIDDAALALLYLTLHDDYRAWKGFDWDVLGRLHDKGMIDNPVGKVKSVVFTREGLERAKALFEAMFKELVVRWAKRPSRRAHPPQSLRVSEYASAGVQQVVLDTERIEERRHRCADDVVVRRGRDGRNAVVPDLAETGVVPADQMKIGFRRDSGGKCCEGKAQKWLRSARC